jgi:alpha,alpha-trehalase
MILVALEIQFRRGASQIVTPLWEGVAGFVDAALERWREPDHGIWEVRGDPKDFTASKVMCWVAAARGAALADERGDHERAERWRAGAEEIKAEVLDKGVSAKGFFRQHYQTDDLDASLLLLLTTGFLPPDDERVKATVMAIADDRSKDGLVLRYRVEGTDTGFSGEEGTFTICSFWLVSALTMIGEIKRARALAQKLLSLAGPLHLYAEEIDTTTASTWGISRRHSPTWPSSKPSHCSLNRSRRTILRTAPTACRGQGGGGLGRLPEPEDAAWRPARGHAADARRAGTPRRDGLDSRREDGGLSHLSDRR